MTRVGMAMRATAESMTDLAYARHPQRAHHHPDLRHCLGLGGAAGVLVGLSFNAISPFMGVDMGIKGLAVDAARRPRQHLRRHDGRHDASAWSR